MGWLRSVGSLKLYVSFAEYSLFYRALLQKRPTIYHTHDAYIMYLLRSSPKRANCTPKRDVFTPKRDLFTPEEVLYTILIASPMGWLRSVGSLKLHVSFAKEPYKTDCFLQKRHIILRSLLIVATPYVKSSSILPPPLKGLSKCIQGFLGCK